MKKVLAFIIAFVIIVTMFLTLESKEQNVGKQEILKVGMITDVAGVDDKSFSQLTWEGLQEFTNAHENIESTYVTPSDTDIETLLTCIDNLILSGNQVIITSGFVFEEVVAKASEQYSEIDFVLIDGEVEKDNVVSIKFKENEAGFLAGVASALETKTGKVAYMGGINVPAVESYLTGFVYGVQYANEYFGLKVEVVEAMYSGTFTDFNVGQMLSAGMFDKGVDIIMATAGVATQGAISEAKQRGDVFIVGCDSDQYEDGLTDESSVILTSGMKHIDNAVVDALTKWLDGNFEGGQTITMDFIGGGVGLPQDNPNLSEDTINKLKEIETLMQNGEIQVPLTEDELNLQ